ncbi:MAG TPA: sigma 54-interacting transcriptional regulator [Kofleriaceae bacterium]|nr:sigma 54-interacting transcriptional regulator [Kofleriaceae bacterium]
MVAVPSGERTPDGEPVPVLDGGAGAGERATEVLSAGERDPAAAARFDRLYLLVFAQSSSRVVPLPRTGEILIGRAPEADVRLDDTAVSRQHAIITLDDGRACLRDLGSQNGTEVDGVRVSGEAPLRSGAVIAVCGTRLAFHGMAAPPRPGRVLEVEALRRQLDAEIERAAALDRSIAVVALRADGAGERLGGALADELRAVDRVAAAGPDEIVALLPELDPDDAGPAASRLVDALARDGGARGGWAAYPRDGDDAGALLAAARDALAGAPPGSAAAAAPAFRAVEIGERRMIVADDAMSSLVALLERLAAVDLPVLLLGETGTGKELAAAALHHLSPRRGGPLVTFNCAAIPEALAESELFGHERGAFSGAVAAKEGRFEEAGGGTVVLDEVGELTSHVQAKLLRVLETRRFTRVGGVGERAVDVRVVAATNRDLLAEVEAGRFRQDLYFRLSAAAVWLPPLRDRPREIPILARSFLDAARRSTGRGAASLTAEALRHLAAHPWPGNVRELKNCMEFLSAATAADTIDAGQVQGYLQRSAGQRAGRPEPRPAPPPEPLPAFRPIKDEVRELERHRMVEALRAARGNQTLAAALIEMPLRTFVAKLKQFAIDTRNPS